MANSLVIYFFIDTITSVMWLTPYRHCHPRHTCRVSHSLVLLSVDSSSKRSGQRDWLYAFIITNDFRCSLILILRATL